MIKVIGPLLMIALLSLSSQAQTRVLSLDEILTLASQKSESATSINQSLEALQSEINARDVVLAPLLNADISAYRDLRENISGTVAREGTSGILGVSLIKPFSTGTTFSLNLGHNLLSRDSTYTEQDIAEWQIKLSQSLWRDGFGRSTEARKEAEKYELLARQHSLEFERQQFFLNVESAYWDLAQAEKEQAFRTETTDRSQSLEKWTRQRVKKFAAENTDLLQVQSLLAQRKLDLMQTKNNLETARNNLRQYIPDLDFQNQTVNSAELLQDRPVVPKIEIPIRLDALSAIHRAQQSRFEAERIVDSTRPLLDIYASYGANGIQPEFNAAWDRAGTARYNQQKVGISFSMNLDGDLRSDQKNAALSNAAALKTRADGLQRASAISWNDLLRNISQLKEQIKVAQEVTQLQSRKLIAERRRFEQGRTTTLQMTTFEVEATESELNLYRLLTALKKAESQMRLYTFDGAS